MKRYTILNLCLLALLCFSCEQDELVEVTPQGDEVVTFRATTDKPLTRAEKKDLTDCRNLRIIAPGYGTGATNQSQLYETDAAGKMIKQDDDIRWSARNMLFTSWYEGDGTLEGTGWTVNEFGGTGTVDYNSNNLEMLIGAHQEVNYETALPTVEFTYEHLVAKLEITLKNVATGGSIPKGTTITFPAIKRMGVFTAGLTAMPAVSLGNSGDELSYTFVAPDDDSTIGKITCYMPPMTANQLVMYSSFTVREGEGGTSYVGTLQNLNLADGIKAGYHYTFDIEVNNDHTALLQAVTLAPWEVNPTNVYNRPSDGIWGLEDLQALSKFINGEETTWNNLTLEDLVDDKGVINLYTDIAFEADDEFAPIGKEGNPFAGYEFNGNGYTISNLALDNPATDNQGIFGLVGDNTTIRNLTVSGVFIEGQNHVGALVGKTSGTGIIIDHCFASGGVVQGVQYTGGIIGLCGAGTIVRNCGATQSTITGRDYVGGFVGQNDGTIGNCYAQTGYIICSGGEGGGVGGGFIGQNNNMVQNCYSAATFSYGLTSIGAFAGYHTAGTNNMTNCHWNTECINNTTCSQVVGNSTEDADGVEQKPGGFSGVAFARISGQVVHQNSTYQPLYDVLNNFVDTNTGLYYLRWTRLSQGLPVFSYSY